MPSIISCIFIFSVDDALVLVKKYCRSIFFPFCNLIKDKYPYLSCINCCTVAISNIWSIWQENRPVLSVPFFFLAIPPRFLIKLPVQFCQITYVVSFYTFASKPMRLHLGSWRAACRWEMSKVMEHIKVLEKALCRNDWGPSFVSGMEIIWKWLWTET